MARKRANSEGSIYKDGDRWVAALMIGHDEAGRPIRRRFTGKTRQAVTGRMTDARDALNQGLEIPDPTVTIAEFAEWWQREVLPVEGLSPKTVAWYGDMTRFVVSHVGAKRLTGSRALTPNDVTGMYPKLNTRRTRSAAKTTLSKMLRSAEVHGLVSRNVARLATSPGDEGKRRDVKAHTSAEIAKLLVGLADTRWHPWALVDVTTGLQPGELMAMHWPDVHLDGAEPYLSVRHSFQYAPTLALKAPKRSRRYRTIPLAPEAVDALKTWREAQGDERDDAGPLWWRPAEPCEICDQVERHDHRLIFTDADGRPYPGLMGLRRAMSVALTGSYPYRLRHTYATHLLEAGTPIHHVAELLGNTVATVERTYSHVLRTKTETVPTISGLLTS